MEEHTGFILVLGCDQSTSIIVAEIEPYRAPLSKNGRLQPVTRHKDCAALYFKSLEEITEGLVDGLGNYPALTARSPDDLNEMIEGAKTKLPVEPMSFFQDSFPSSLPLP